MSTLAAPSLLHQSGRQIVNAANTSIKLRGVNFGGCLMWNAALWGGDQVSESDIYNALVGVVGSSSAAAFRSSVYTNCVTEGDFQGVAALGFNVVRLPFNYRFLMDDNASMVWKASAWQVLDNVVDWAEKHSVSVILSMYSAPGGQGVGYAYDASVPGLWSSALRQNETIAMWKAIAQRYATRSGIAGFDLLNEPLPLPNDAALRALYSSIISEIRKVDTSHILFLQGSGAGGKNFDAWASPVLDSNVVYAPHQYPTLFGQYEINIWVNLSTAHNVPVWIGEFLESYLFLDENHINLFETNPIAGWAHWSWKRTYGTGFQQLVSIDTNPVWSSFMASVPNISSAKPTAAALQTAMDAILVEMLYCNEFVDRIVAQALLLNITGDGLPVPYYCPPATPPPPPPAAPGMPWLKQQGLQVVQYPSNISIFLNGVNLGGIYLWEGWILGGLLGFDSETDIMAGLESVVGPTVAWKFHMDVLTIGITEADFKAMAELGINSVRVGFNHRILMDLNNSLVWKDSGWQILDNLVNWGEKYGVYIIFEMHGVPGGQALAFVYDSSWPLLWDSKLHQDETTALWKAIAQRYAKRSAVAAYNLFGEPWPSPTNESIVPIYRRIINAIRQVDPWHIIILDGTQASQNFDWVTTPLDSNMLYSFHLYSWAESNATGRIYDYGVLSRQQNVPLWVGEWGENDHAAIQTQVNQFRNESTIVGWAYFTWKKVPNYFDDLVGIPASDAWKAIVNWAPKYRDTSQVVPSVANVTQAMAEFLQALHFCNNTVDLTMASIISQRNITQVPNCTLSTAPAPSPTPALNYPVTPTTTTTTQIPAPRSNTAVMTSSFVAIWASMFVIANLMLS